MTSPYILAASERTRLPLSVTFTDDRDDWYEPDIYVVKPHGRGATAFLTRRPEAATRAYLRLCESLPNPGNPSLPVTAGCSASPEGMV